MSEYRKIDAVSQSILKAMLRSPAHALVAMTLGREQTPAMLFGEAFHCAVLEPDEFPKRFTEKPPFDRRSNRGKEDYQAWEILNGKKKILTEDGMAKLDAMRSAIKAHPFAPAFLDGAETEIPLTWTDEKTGVFCKGLVDFAAQFQDMIVLGDIKTTMDARARKFGNDLYTLGYHIQAAFYLDGWKLARSNTPASKFVFIAIEKEPPFGIKLYDLSEVAIEVGRQTYQALLQTYKECKETGNWWGYDPSIQTLDLPAWATKASEDVE